MKEIFFFIGTEAELIKIFPVIMEAKKQGKFCNIIASGQNNILNSRIMKHLDINGKCVELSNEKDIVKTARGLLSWFFKTKRSAISIIKREFDIEKFKGASMVVHGDTVSTVMGALLGKKLGCEICHVEAGLRSHNWLNPFPEEIDRMIVSKMATKHFAPGEDASNNLARVKGEVVNTNYNTILDSLNISREFELLNNEVEELLGSTYFVFVMHRQENVANKVFFERVINKIKNASNRMHCVVILHKITEIALEEMGLLEEMKEDECFTLLPRVDYFDFMKLLDGSQFVITDGGSNQEELRYMGKPCLIMRKTTERNDGLGSNAIIFNGNIQIIDEFICNYHDYIVDTDSEYSMSPSKVIVESI